jgi:NTE family protein
VVLDRGPLEQALRATMSIPGVFDPVRLDGRLLVDGGVLDNVPVDVARRMGVDVVVAVKVDEPADEEFSENLAGLADRALRLLMDATARSGLAAADVVIVPDLAGLRMTDYVESARFVERGYEAAAQHAAVLSRSALAPADWEEYQRERRERMRQHVPVPEFVEVHGTAARHAARLAHGLREHVGRDLDVVALEEDLERVIGMGRWASASYGLVRRDGRTGLRVQVREKSHGPPFVRFAARVRNEQEDLLLDAGARVIILDPTTEGSELRLEGTSGSTRAAAAELLQPLGFGPVFVAPRVAWARRRDDLYAGEDLLAVYRRERAGAGGDLGCFLGRLGEVRAGYEIRSLHSVLGVGDPLLPEPDGREQVARLRILLEGLDRPTIPRRGLRLEQELRWWLEVPGAPRDFGRADMAGLLALPVWGGDVVHVAAEASASFGGSSPWTHQPALGGLFRLSSFGVDRFRGRHVAFARCGYLKSVRQLPGLGGDRLYAAAFAEAGSAYDRRRDARLQGSGSLGFLADTPLGPAWLGVAYGTEGNHRVDFALGNLFR